MNESLLTELLALHPLCEFPRSGWLLRGVSAAESIGDHVLGTAFVVLALAPRVSPPIDTDRAVSLALVHDAPEALTGDLPRPGARLFPAGAKEHAEDEAAKLLLAPLSDLAWQRFREYRANESREARFVHVCDRLELGVRLVGYLSSGARGLQEFVDTVRAVDCAEFAPAAKLQSEIVAWIDRHAPRASADGARGDRA